MEAATSVLDREEQQQLQQQQKTALDNLEEKNTFVAAYTSCRKERAASGSKHSKELLKSLKEYPKVMPLILTHAQAKKLLPQGAVCWRGNVRGEWWGHLRPYKSFHKKVADFGSESDCMKSMLQTVWMQWAEKEGLDAKSICPMVGLF